MSLEKLAYNRQDAAQVLSISISTLDKLIATGELNPVLVGAKRLFTHVSLIEFLNHAPQVRN